MPLTDRYYDDVFQAILIEDNAEKEANWKPSGKLSASMLAEPLQWQVLKMYGFERVLDPFLLRKFKRGSDVEKEVLEIFKKQGIVSDFQKKAEYRGVIGMIDAMMDTSHSNFKQGIIPFEIKSVSNAKFKRLLAEGAIQRGHALQAALYALSEGTEYFGVCYISTDDYRLLTFIEPVDRWKPEIDRIIDGFNDCIVKGIIPVFDPPELWMKKTEYCKFPEWRDLTFDQCQAKLAEYLKSKHINENGNN